MLTPTGLDDADHTSQGVAMHQAYNPRRRPELVPEPM
jgi:hypothetical protein